MFEHKMAVPHMAWTNRPNHLMAQEGGALNAGYTPVDALCAISNKLGKHGLEYNKDWWWEGFGTDWNVTNHCYVVHLQFAKEEYKLLLHLTEE